MSQYFMLCACARAVWGHIRRFAWVYLLRCLWHALNATLATPVCASAKLDQIAECVERRVFGRGVSNLTLPDKHCLASGGTAHYLFYDGNPLLDQDSSGEDGSLVRLQVARVQDIAYGRPIDSAIPCTRIGV
ncbi:hypothetical protein P691DRAFT_810014 [Macrolepiota fuliginosa MF-IS2]|uniref:Uncharacterized protein n=1 Tax=Macrolepiota fuliginosa MF-IS2 TaxID=1400762 RepID=A0A9P5XFU1_9AGAR|nr:hypothetical protein P691DRAFT_810014 [Macrolepiota fuliginosa MF-IS2]